MHHHVNYRNKCYQKMIDDWAQRHQLRRAIHPTTVRRIKMPPKKTAPRGGKKAGLWPAME